MRQGARGVVLLTALLLLLLMSALVLGLSRLLRDEQRIGSQLDDAQRAFQLAELGLQAGEQALAKLPFAAQVAGMSTVRYGRASHRLPCPAGSRVIRRVGSRAYACRQHWPGSRSHRPGSGWMRAAWRCCTLVAWHCGWSCSRWRRLDAARS